MKASNSRTNTEGHFFFRKRKESPEDTNVFRDLRGGYINEFKLFLQHFKCLPNLIEETAIDCRKAYPWIVKKYSEVIQDTHFSQIYMRSMCATEYDDVYLVFKEEIIINLDARNGFTRVLFSNNGISFAQQINKELQSFRERQEKEKPQIYLMAVKNGELEFFSANLVKPRMRIADNYNNDLEEIHRIILKRLNKKEDKGLVLLHGKPGTGKTSYIRFLISSVKKKVIFMPPNVAEAIISPSFIMALTENPNSILVIEDAETILVDRLQQYNSAVSTLLNIADGLLSDCLNIQIICSFNTHLSKIDSALLRKGRLIAQYEFKELEASKAQTLSKKLGFTTTIAKPMCLTDIYNQAERNFASKERNTIGFNAQ